MKRRRYVIALGLPLVALLANVSAAAAGTSPAEASDR